jgi:hypothetical protein
MKLEEILTEQQALTLPLMKRLIVQRQETSFGMYSPSLSTNSQSDNVIAMHEAQMMMRGMGLEFYNVIGEGQEKNDDGTYRLVKENSYVVINPILKQMQKLASSFDQTCFIYAGPDSNGIVLYQTDNLAKIDSWTNMKTGQGEFGYTVLNDGSEFYFA